MKGGPTLLIALVCFVLATGIAIASTIHLLSDESQYPVSQPSSGAQPKLISVVAATVDIARGAPVARASLRMQAIAPPLPEFALTSYRQAENTVAKTSFAAGQLLMKPQLIQAGSAKGGLSFLVPKGMRAVALSVDEEAAVGNFVTSEDRIDIQLVLPPDVVSKLGITHEEGNSAQAHILLQDIQVLSAGSTLQVNDSGRAKRLQTITVEVTPEQAQMLAVVKESGKFYLALRHPGDDSVSASTPLSGKTALAQGNTPSKPRKKRYVEIIEGTQTIRHAVEDK